MFLITLRKPLRTTLAVVDFIGKTLEDIIDRVLRLDSLQTSQYVPDCPTMGSIDKGGYTIPLSSSMYDVPQPQTLNSGMYFTIALSNPSFADAHTRVV